ncbi:Plant invertase/pectin methylesterase inhibitor superfamily [Euphorbia peplus]|nr:Plant invertase/pectin methylesterase inhibitor superfamily [Euphorbia peplus]
MGKLSLAIFYAYFLSYSLCFVHASEKITSCAQTPHPKVCKHHINTTTNHHHSLQSKDKTPFSFRDQSIIASLNQAILAHKKLSISMNIKSFDKKSKLALADCLELYEEAVDLLNRSLSSSNPSDSQTWLSGAIANQQTCENGFIDFKISYRLKVFPYMTSFSKLVSNSLAINKANSAFHKKNVTVGGRRLLGFGGFPWWVSSGDRKLIETDKWKADIVVAKDGSGDYKTISEAVNAMHGKRSGSGRFVVHVKKGVYKENIEIKKSVSNLMFVGDGIDATVVTGNRNANDGSTTFRSATFAVAAEGFIAKDMTFENTAGPQKHQAVALRSNADKSVFYRCSFKGYQDTLYVNTNRQFYRNCDIYGTVDFIFGDARVVLQNCNIYVRKPMSKQKNTITAQARKDRNENTGIIIQNSIVTASSDLKPVQGSIKTYLGRPWQKYSKTVIMKSTLDKIIEPEGWFPWSGNFALSTLYYAEYMNTGGGASTRNRVKWPGYHVLTKASDAEKFTVGKFLDGGSWIPKTGVPVNFGL